MIGNAGKGGGVGGKGRGIFCWSPVSCSREPSPAGRTPVPSGGAHPAPVVPTGPEATFINYATLCSRRAEASRKWWLQRSTAQHYYYYCCHCYCCCCLPHQPTLGGGVPYYSHIRAPSTQTHHFYYRLPAYREAALYLYRQRLKAHIHTPIFA